MSLRSYFGKQNSTLGSVVPLAMFCFSFVVCKEPDLNHHSWLDVPELQPHEWRQIVVLVVVRVIITREALKKLLSPNPGQNNETFFIHKIEGQTCHGL